MLIFERLEVWLRRLDWPMAVAYLYGMSIQMPFPVRMACLYGGFAYFGLRLILHWRNVATFVAFRPSVWLFSALAVVSTFWSIAPDITFRVSFQLLVLALSCCFLLQRFTLKQLFWLYFIVLWIVALGNLPLALTYHDPDPFHGLFTHKNFFAKRMMPFVVACFCVLVMWRGKSLPFGVPPVALKAMCIFGVLSGIWMIVLAQSGSVTVALFVCLSLVGGLWLWSKPAWFRLFGILAGAFVVVGAIGLYLNFVQEDPVDMFFKLLGKDKTFTARTYLWEIADRYIKDRPMLGYGFGGFWATKHGEFVNQRWALGPGQTIFFHSAYREAAIACGFIGMGIFIYSLIAACWASLWANLRRPDFVTAFFGAMVVFGMLRSPVENDFMQPYEPIQVLFWFASAGLPIYMAQRQMAEQQRLRRARPVGALPGAPVEII